MKARKDSMKRLQRIVSELGFIPPMFRCTVNEAAYLCGVSHEEIRQQLKDGKLKPLYTSVGSVIPEGGKPPTPRPMIPYAFLIALLDEEAEKFREEKEIRDKRVRKLLNT